MKVSDFYIPSVKAKPQGKNTDPTWIPFTSTIAPVQQDIEQRVCKETVKAKRSKKN